MKLSSSPEPAKDTAATLSLTAVAPQLAPLSLCACHAGSARPGFYNGRLFPRLMDWALSREALEGRRAQLLESVSGHVLEIGFGTGLNLFHYASELTSLTAVDNNPGMLALARPRVRRASFPVDLRAADVLHLPMDDGTFDCAVSTFSMCSITPPAEALAEVFRVLKPGGRLYFLEHGRAQSPRAVAWQKRINPLQRRLAGGCELDRDIPMLLEGTGFDARALEVSLMSRSPKIFGTLYSGFVSKPLASIPAS